MLPYFEWTTISLGPLTLQVWGLWVAIGIGCSLYLLHARAKRTGESSEVLLNIAFIMLVFGFIGARVAHIVWYEPAYFLANPWEVFAVWHGGLSSFGGIIGAGAGLLYAFRKYRITKNKQLALLDEFSFVALFGWLFARVGCFCIHDHIGMPCQGSCMLAVNGPDVPRYDMALLEILALLPLAVLFYSLRNTRKTAGWYTSVLFIYYGIVRFFLDFLRATDIASADVRYMGLTPGQYASIFMIVGGALLYKKSNRD